MMSATEDSALTRRERSGVSGAGNDREWMRVTVMDERERSVPRADGVESDRRAVPQAEGERAAPRNPFSQIVRNRDHSYLTDEILPTGILIETASVDVLNCFINYVELQAVITERDPEEDERYISISNQFYTHFHEFGTVVHVIGSSARHWWYFCYDIDSSDCTIGRVERRGISFESIRGWVERERLARLYPRLEIDIRNLHGWRSFQ